MCCTDRWYYPDWKNVGERIFQTEEHQLKAWHNEADLSFLNSGWENRGWVRQDDDEWFEHDWYEYGTIDIPGFIYAEYYVCEDADYIRYVGTSVDEIYSFPKSDRDAVRELGTLVYIFAHSKIVKMDLTDMQDEITALLGECGYDAHPITGKIWPSGTDEGYQLYKVETDIEIDRTTTARVTWIQRYNYESEYPNDIETVETIFFEAHKI